MIYCKTVVYIFFSSHDMDYEIELNRLIFFSLAFHTIFKSLQMINRYYP